MTLLLALLALPGSGAISQPPGNDPFARAQMLLDVADGRKIHLRCMGAGSPTVVLTAGLGESGENWRAVMAQIAASTQVCAWDRAGTGFSDAGDEPQDVAHTTADLERALRRAQVEPPYVLVGHSIGSFETLLFAYRHLSQVAGIVLIDPSSPYQHRTFAAASPKFAQFAAERRSERSALLRQCLATLKAGEAERSDCGSLPASLDPARRAGLRSPSCR